MSSTAIPDRAAGVQLHLTSLPGGRLGEPAREFVRWLAAAGQSVWQVLPLTVPDEGRPPVVSGVGPGWIPMVRRPRKAQAGHMENIRASLARQGLVRSSDRGLLAGVCAGVGRRLGLTPWMTRLLFLVTLVVVPGSQFLVYPALWFLMPADDSVVATSYAPPASR